MSGQYEVPTFIMESEDNKLEQYPSINGQELYCLDSFKSAITKYKITNYVINIDQIELGKLGVDPKNYIWIDYKDKNANLTTSTSKAIDLVN